jgi:hypothetical protein
MPSSWMWRLVAYIGTDVSQKRITAIIRVNIRESAAAVAVTRNWNRMCRPYPNPLGPQEFEVLPLVGGGPSLNILYNSDCKRDVYPCVMFPDLMILELLEN